MGSTVKKKVNPILDDEENKVDAGSDTGATDTATDNEAGAEKVDGGEDATAEKPVASKPASSGKPREMIEKIALPSERKLANGAVPNNAQAALTQDAKKMKAFLEGQEKFPIIIPLEPGEKKGPHCFKEGWCNGFYWKVPKGELVRVPEEIFNILSNNMQLTNEAGADKLVSRSADVEEALS